MNPLLKNLQIQAFYHKKDIEIGEIHVKRVNRTFPGIEIVLFCKNDAPEAIETWRKINLPHSLGTIVFFEKILPIILEVRKNVGCEYVFLFAADSSDDMNLVIFYKDRLKLKEPDDLGTTKPFYDWTSFFLYRKISKNRNLFRGIS